MVTETDLELGDGRTLHAYHTGAADADGRLAVFWHHGSPNIGAPPQPLFSAAERLGIRWVSYDRPGYGGATPRPERDVASAAADASAVADALGIDRFALMGHSSGGSHALACAALLPERVLGVVVVAGMAPIGAEGSTGSMGSGQPAWPSCARRQPGALRWRSTWLSQTTSRSSPPKTKPLSLANGRGSSTSSMPPSPAAWEGSSTTISQALARGGSTPPTSLLQPFSCTVAGIGWCLPRTGSGSRAIARQQNCGCTRKTGTSRF